MQKKKMLLKILMGLLIVITLFSFPISKAVVDGEGTSEDAIRSALQSFQTKNGLEMTVSELLLRVWRQNHGLYCISL